MKKLFILLTVILSFTYCKGPGSGPLVRESFNKEDRNQNTVAQSHKSSVTTEKINVVVEPCNDCVTIAKLLANKQSYSGKVIKVKGNVTKFNPAIMGKNWVHIQDGSEFKGGFDLTVTTDIQTSVGETLTFEGKIVLDKDFGYGYFYNVLMEDGKVIEGIGER
jgi:hypothetical protein